MKERAAMALMATASVAVTVLLAPGLRGEPAPVREDAPEPVA